MSASVHPARPVASRRGPLRRILETRGLVGGHRVRHVGARLLAADGTPLAGTYLPAAGGETAVLLLHGFAAHRRKPAYARLADGLASDTPVLALDLRGHGDSAGASTLGDREEQDVAAGAAWLRAAGHRRVVAVGLSMGATAVMHAASRGVLLDALVVISPTSRIRETPQTDAMRRLKRVWESPVRRRALRLVTGVRLAGPRGWRRPEDPVSMVARFGAPLLVVHGDDDAYFPLSDAEELVDAALGPATLWREPAGFGHAEDGITPALVGALASALVGVVERGVFPSRDDARTRSARHAGGDDR